MSDTKIIYLDSQETFLEARKGKIGSSDIAAICGLNPWCTPLQVFLEMTGKVAPVEENEAMWLGKKLEPVVAEMFGKRHPNFILEEPRQMWVNGWACATPDRLVAEAQEDGTRPINFDRILECKTSSFRMAQIWSAGLPDSVACQVQWQLGVTGKESAYVAALVGGREFVEYQVAFDPNVFEQLLELGNNFMEKVKSDTPPEPVAEDSDTVKKLFQPNPELEIELEAEAIDKALELIELKKVCSVNDKRKKELETWLRLSMGNASIGISSNVKINLTTVHKAGHTVGPVTYSKLSVKEVA